MKSRRNCSDNGGMCLAVCTHTRAEDPVGVPDGAKCSLVLAISAWCIARGDAHSDEDVLLFDIDVATIEVGLSQFLPAFLCGGEGYEFLIGCSSTLPFGRLQWPRAQHRRHMRTDLGSCDRQ